MDYISRTYEKIFNFIWIVLNAITLYTIIDIIGYPIDFIIYIKRSYINFSLSGIVNVLEYLIQLFIPSIPIMRPNWLPHTINNLIFGYAPEVIESLLPKINTTERWFYLNGMANSKKIAKQTCTRLEEIFKRPIDCIYNPTNSFVVDLFECITEKQWNDKYPITLIVYQTLVTTLTDDNIEKVVIICHSQGTIIMACVVGMMIQLMPKYVSKLEIYAFANCSTKMNYTCEYNGNNYPYIENIGNYNDTIAKLGMFAPDKSVSISGEKYINKIKRGHIMDISYIDKFDTKVEYFNEKGNYSKLYNYLKRS